MATNGSDSNNGSEGSPWRTLSHANQQLTPGDTLYIRGGTYTEHLNSDFTASGTADNRITISGYPGETVVFDGNNQSSFLYRVPTGASYITLKDFEITNYSASAIFLWSDVPKQGWIFDGLNIYDSGLVNNGQHTGGIDFAYASDMTIRNCRFDNIGWNLWNHHAIYMQAHTTDIKIYNNHVSNMRFGGAVHGWHYPNSNNVQVYNNIFTDNIWGVILADGSENVEIYNNTLVNNDYGIDLGQSGYDVTWGVKNVTIKNNVTYSGSGETGLRVGSFNINDVTIDYNLWYASDSTPFVWNSSNWSLTQLRSNTPHGDNGIQADPQFVNLGGRDYRLSSSSPGINSGASLPSISVDYDGVTRPQGPAYDMGAYEQ